MVPVPVPVPSTVPGTWYGYKVPSYWFIVQVHSTCTGTGTGAVPGYPSALLDYGSPTGTFEFAHITGTVRNAVFSDSAFLLPSIVQSTFLLLLNEVSLGFSVNIWNLCPNF